MYTPLIFLLAVASTVFAVPTSGTSPDCQTNAECIQRGLPLLPPPTPRKRSLRPRSSPLPPTANTFSYTGTKQYFHPQQDGRYRITAVGASGGPGITNGVPGHGVQMEGTVYLTAGTSVSVVVGGMGVGLTQFTPTSTYHAGGGGGGTYIYVLEAPAAPILVSGGGGGGGSGGSGNSVDAGRPASTTTSGTDGGAFALGGSPTPGGVGGKDGQGGRGGVQGGGGGGAGWYSSGQGSTQSGQMGPTFAGGSDDYGLTQEHVNPGGYGGGGGGGNNGGGGGGGYSGGGTGVYSAGGGGGGSFLNPTVNGRSTTLTSCSVVSTVGDGSASFTYVGV